MKITKKQLRKIINEAVTKGDRALGLFANDADVEAARDAILAINNEVLEDAFKELNNDHDAQDMAKAAMAEFFGNMCQSMGYYDMYYAIREFSK